MINEKWKQIPNMKNIYASNFGKIKRIYPNREHFYTPSHGKCLYKTICISIDGDSWTYYVHKLVALAFLPNPDNLAQVNHKDLNKLNNCVDNLEWITHRDNIRHAKKNLPDFQLYGEDAGRAILTNSEAKEIIEIFRAGGDIDAQALADRYGVHKSTIKNIQRGHSWKHMSGENLVGRMTSRIKLDEEKVKEIKKMIRNGVMLKDIAIKFGVSKELISGINLGKKWKHVIPEDIK